LFEHQRLENWNLPFRRYVMPVLKFKNFEDLDKFEREGKGVSWQFTPDEAYINKALRSQTRVPFPARVYKFKTFEEAEAWEREWWIKSGATKRAR